MIENKTKKEPKMKNAIIEMKLAGFSNRSDEAEDQVCHLEDKGVKTTQLEQQKKKEF